jgi:hypothetical protein
MGRFRNLATDVVVSVDDSKDERFGDGWESATESKTPAKKSASSKTSK